ncbi:MAG: [Ruminococcus sp.]|uniref:[FeFe] hydrogenase H-cluster radical SAM maturase HydE n=1 Tax=Ruminococcus sp. TaxID=41978 RepID=UPI0028734F6C|nr:[FeFe] hydrogenase H-cluster radical SAM maturase HydE [Ruminococcus sp.]MBQ3284754.1 [FeFe] hydrogenase H-cluster radical SAM maturase HydE [Ruminococcus sp.]
MTDVLVKKLRENRDLSDGELRELIESSAHDEALRQAADKVRRERYGDAVYLRGLIEFTSYCKQNCLYCGLRAGNRNAQRYRLSREEILSCCDEGYALGYRTFVLQGGEDPYYTDDMICDIVRSIKEKYPDCAVTLSIGEKPRQSYERYFAAGADRYLLRHETADPEHYAKLHTDKMSSENRKHCLRDLKEIGYQVGAGFMVGSPYQTTENLIADLRFLQELQPDMIGIGPYISHKDTPFRDEKNGTAELTLRMLSILRLMFPYALLPSTTALGTIRPDGRELGLKAGGNVVMPNLSPVQVRDKYAIYDNKICTGEESAQCRGCLEKRIESAGYRAVTDRGDVKRASR